MKIFEGTKSKLTSIRTTYFKYLFNFNLCQLEETSNTKESLYTLFFEKIVLQYLIHIIINVKVFRGYLFFSVKDGNLFHRVDTIGNIFTSGEATKFRSFTEK